MYPLTEPSFGQSEQTYLDASPLKDTSYETILNSIENIQKTCLKGPVVEIPHNADVMFHTRNCKTVHEYLNKDLYDIEGLDRELREYFGEELVQECT